MKLLTESFVQKCVVKYLRQNGWSKNLVTKEAKEHGVDIKVRNNKFSRYFLIEVKGDASSLSKSPSSQREVNFNLVLGQIITRMQSNGVRGYKYRYKYGIAVPNSFKDKVLRRLPYDVCDKLNLYAFFVDELGKVKMYGWEELKKCQINNDG